RSTGAISAGEPRRGQRRPGTVHGEEVAELHCTDVTADGTGVAAAVDFLTRSRAPALVCRDAGGAVGLAGGERYDVHEWPASRWSHRGRATAVVGELTKVRVSGAVARPEEPAGQVIGDVVAVRRRRSVDRAVRRRVPERGRDDGAERAEPAA